MKIHSPVLVAILSFVLTSACYVDARPTSDPSAPLAAPTPAAATSGDAAATQQAVPAAEPATTTAADSVTDAAAKPVCTIEAWVSDPDPNGLNVRDTPAGKVIGKVPFGDRGPEGFGPAPTVNVVGVSGSWLRIAGDHGITPGWVHSSMIRVQIAYAGAIGGAQPLRAGPSDSAKVVGSVAPEYSAVIKDCAPGWVNLDIPDAGKSGWLEISRTCWASNTTCPG